MDKNQSKPRPKWAARIERIFGGNATPQRRPEREVLVKKSTGQGNAQVTQKPPNMPTIAIYRPILPNDNQAPMISEVTGPVGRPDGARMANRVPAVSPSVNNSINRSAVPSNNLASANGRRVTSPASSVKPDNPATAQSNGRNMTKSKATTSFDRQKALPSSISVTGGLTSSTPHDGAIHPPASIKKHPVTRTTVPAKGAIPKTFSRRQIDVSSPPQTPSLISSTTPIYHKPGKAESANVGASKTALQSPADMTESPRRPGPILLNTPISYTPAAADMTPQEVGIKGPVSSINSQAGNVSSRPSVVIPPVAVSRPSNRIAPRNEEIYIPLQPGPKIIREPSDPSTTLHSVTDSRTVEAITRKDRRIVIRIVTPASAQMSYDVKSILLYNNGEPIPLTTTLRQLKVGIAQLLGIQGLSLPSKTTAATPSRLCNCAFAGTVVTHGIWEMLRCRLHNSNEEDCDYPHNTIEQDKICQICQATLTDRCQDCESLDTNECPLVVNAGCGHTFHHHCFTQYTNETCPGGCSRSPSF